MLAQDAPERLAAAQQAERRLAERDLVTAQIVSVRAGGRMSVEESIGRWVRRSRSRKSKMLCLAASTPVANDDQATGDIGGEGGRQVVEAALLGEAREGGQVALVHPAARELRIEPVQAEDDHAARVGAAAHARPADRAIDRGGRAR